MDQNWTTKPNSRNLIDDNDINEEEEDSFDATATEDTNRLGNEYAMPPSLDRQATPLPSCIMDDLTKAPKGPLVNAVVADQNKQARANMKGKEDHRLADHDLCSRDDLIEDNSEDMRSSLGPLPKNLGRARKGTPIPTDLINAPGPCAAKITTAIQEGDEDEGDEDEGDEDETQEVLDRTKELPSKGLSRKGTPMPTGLITVSGSYTAKQDTAIQESDEEDE